MSVLVVVRVEESCVFGIEVCQKIDWDVCAVEETVEAGERKSGVRSAVGGGNQEVTMLGVDLGCQKVG